ncbi:MAG: hypothetical protein ACE366_11845 [Bradymonadia bacterium]
MQRRTFTSSPRRGPALAALIVGLCLLGGLLMGGVASAQNPLDAATGGGAKKKVPWRGSFITGGYGVSHRTFDKGAQLTYDPNQAAQFSVLARWWLGDSWHLRANTFVLHEFTENNITTQDNETQWFDTFVGVGGNMQVPGLGMIATGLFDVRLPTSKFSQNESLMFGVRGGLGLIKPFKVLKGLALIANVQMTRFFHEFTTGEDEEQRINGNSASRLSSNAYPGFDSFNGNFIGNGVSNARWRMIYTGVVSLTVTNWLTFNVSGSVINDYLYRVNTLAEDFTNQTFAPGETPYTGPQQDTRFRGLLSTSVGANIQPWSAVGFNLSADAFHGQLEPNSEANGYYTPFFNRFTTYNVGVVLNMGALVR